MYTSEIPAVVISLEFHNYSFPPTFAGHIFWKEEKHVINVPSGDILALCCQLCPDPCVCWEPLAGVWPAACPLPGDIQGDGGGSCYFPFSPKKAHKRGQKAESH